MLAPKPGRGCSKAKQAQTRYALAVLGMASEAAGDLHLAYAAFVYVKTGSAAIPLTEVKSRVEAAKKDKVMTDTAAHILERFIQAQTEQTMHAAMRRID